MQLPIKFETETKTVMFGDEAMMVENLIPILPQKEKEKRHREIESILFNVLKKYPGKASNISCKTA